MGRLLRTGILFCVILLCQVSAQTNTDVQTELKPAAIQPGDSVEHVLRVMGEPRVDCPLKGGKRILMYEEGEIHLLDGKVASCTILTEEQLAEKRERERKKKERAAAREKETSTAHSASGTQTSAQKEFLLRKAAADLEGQIAKSEAVATRRMTNVIELFNLMVLKGGKSRLRYERDLLENMPNNTLEEFYNIDFNFEYFERIYDRNPGATLTLNSLYKEHALFIRDYEKLLKYEVAQSKVQRELKIVQAEKRSRQ